MKNITNLEHTTRRVEVDGVISPGEFFEVWDASREVMRGWCEVAFVDGKTVEVRGPLPAGTVAGDLLVPATKLEWMHGNFNNLGRH